MRILLLFLTGMLMTSLVVAQSEDKLIESTVRQVFLAMEKGDSALLHRAFATQVTDVSIRMDENGKTTVNRGNSIAPFLKAVGTPHAETWFEEAWGLKVSRDGSFAHAWCDYAFYVGNKFSHCGVDSFHLIREDGAWKIFHIADTRRTTGCEVPDAIKKKHQ